MHSPYFTNLRQHLHTALRKAENEISVAVARFTDEATARLIVQKAQEGVRIQMFIVDDEINQKLDLQQVENAGVELLRIPKEEGLLHFKFCIIDGHTVVYGSANWTYSAFTHNQEQITIVEDDPTFVERFQEEFSELCKRFAKQPISDETNVQQHPERLLLQQEIRLLDAVIAETETKIAEIHATLNRFERLYYRLLGKLLREVLHLRNMLAEAKAELTQKIEDFQAAEEQQQEYEAFTKEEQPKGEFPHEEEQKKEPKKQKSLHRLFREAVKLCHPDKVEAQYREVAQAVFVRLKEAFDRQDIETVSEILEELRSGIAWQIPPEEITDIEVLRQLRDKYKKQLQEKQGILQQLLQTSSYNEIVTADSWDVLIEQSQQQLEYEKKRLKQELKELKSQ